MNPGLNTLTAGQVLSAGPDGRVIFFHIIHLIIIYLYLLFMYYFKYLDFSDVGEW
jgi:hypothetical protein